ncbi:AlbA family DNA-binding domain-containing protein [Fodinibius sediminis]|uniref:DNA-binding domain-containing protein n=1 Tax=Fodinibius sediminis TaxID=1214077 RepID=A0A521AJN9_9BACT|nr:ATP-binding protein [Fodinibius sediminis]SMO35013.1 Putative DNA-binding domain-containing protein [Fodinibius sediminis]
MYYNNHSTVSLSEMDYLDVKNLAQTGEGAYLEFKRTIPSAYKIAREIAAFANTKGGTLLIGVDDDCSLIGVSGYQEEEYLLKKAAEELCRPRVDIDIEIVHFGERDLLVIRVPESDEKPIVVQAEEGDIVLMREDDRNKVASRELIEVIKNKNSDEGVTFEYGQNEQKLFRYLNEYGEITVKKFAHLVNISPAKASATLVNLVSADILNLFRKKNVDYFTYSRKCKNEC